MRRIEHLIRQIRRQTDNVVLGNDDGVSDEEILQYFNDSQKDIQSAIIRQHKEAFLEEYLMDSVLRQERYSLPDDIWQFGSIVTVEYSDNGSIEDYRPLDYVLQAERRSIYGTPIQYSIQENELLLNPIPNASQLASIRIVYNRSVPDLDIRRGSLSVLTQAAGVISAITIDPLDPLFLPDDWSQDDFLTLVDTQGNIKSYGIPYTSISDLGVVSIDGGTFTLRDGETVDITDIPLRGKKVTTHCQLADSIERFILSYVAWKLYKRDSSQDAMGQESEMNAIKSEIVQSYALLNQDHIQIPLLTYEYY